MSIKKYISSLILSAAAMTTSAKSEPVQAVTDNVTKSTNATLMNNEGMESASLANRISTQKKIGNISVGLHGRYSDLGSGVELQALISEDRYAIGGLMEKLQNATTFLIAASKDIGNLNLTASYSDASQDAKEALHLDAETLAKLNGNNISLSLSYSELKLLDQIGIKFTRAETEKSILNESHETTVEISREEFALATREITNIYDNIVRQIFTGGVDERGEVNMSQSIGDNHQIDLAIGHQKVTIENQATSHTTTKVKYTNILSENNKFNITAESSGYTQGAEINFSHLFANKESELTFTAGRREYKNLGGQSENYVSMGMNVSFGGSGSGYSNTSKLKKTPTDFIKESFKDKANPRAVGYQKTEREKVLLSTTTVDTPNAITTNIGTVTVNPDSTITVEFAGDTTKFQKLSSESPDSNNTVNGTLSYSLKITSPDGNITEYTGITPPWTSQKMSAGKYKVVAITKNTVNGQTSTTESDPIYVDVSEDKKSVIDDLKTLNIGYTDAVVAYSIEDEDGFGISGCQVKNSTASCQTINADRKTISITGGTPGETAILEVSYWTNEIQPDGTIKKVSGIKEISITFKSEKDTPETISTPTTSATYDNITVHVNIDDKNKISNKWSALLKNGIEVARISGETTTFSGLEDDTDYTVITGATVGILNPDNTITDKDVVSDPVPVKTLKAAVDNPTTITLDATNITSSSILAKCNITDLEGASGTCTISGGPGATSWTIGSDRTISGLSPNTTYTISVVGYVYILEKDGTLTRKDISESKSFTTLPPANTAPIGTADTANTTANTPVVISVLDNDTDAENNTLSIGSFGQGSHGTVTQVGSTLRYTPANGYSGSDTFTYIVSDSNLSSSPVTVTVNTAAPINVPGTIGSPSLDSKTHNAINTTPGSTTGMTNIRVDLYSNVGLTTLVGSNSTGDFTGLSASTTYYAVTVGDDYNENTGATETKRSTTLTVTTDAIPNLGGPTLNTPTFSANGSTFDGTLYHAPTSFGDLTIGNLAANDPDGIGSYTIVSAIFGTLASGSGTLPTTVTIPSASTFGHFGETDTITVTVTDIHPTNPQTNTTTMNYTFSQ